MAINNPYLPIKVITNGVLDTFAFNWSLTQAQDIKVYFEDSRGVKTLVDTGDYTLQRNTGENGGNIIFNTPPTTGQTLIIERDEEKTQEKEFSNTKSFNLKYFQDALDKLTRWCQEQDYEIGQAIKIPETAASDEDDVIDIWNRIILSDAGESIKYAKIESGNLYVKSKTGSWIMMPKSSNIKQIRQRVEYVDSVPVYIFEYTIGGSTWKRLAFSADLEDVRTLAQNALDAVANVACRKYSYTTTAGQSTLTVGEDLTNKSVDLYWNGVLTTSDWSASGTTITLSFVPDAGDKIVVMVGSVRQTIAQGDLDAHNANPNAHASEFAAKATKVILRRW